MSQIKSKSLIVIAALLLFGAVPHSAAAQTERSPSDVVRDFYKAMREHRFKDAWSLTIYKPAVVDLTAAEMEDLLPDFEERAAKIPPQIDITGEQIQGNVATVFVKVPVVEASGQVTSEPVNLFKSGGSWIIGDEASDAEVKKKGRRFFLDALIEQHQNDVEDLLKRLIALQIVYATRHNGEFGDLPGLIKELLVAKEAGDPRASGYNLRITVGADKKSYVAMAEPTRYGRTGKLSFWMDQTGAIKSVDNGGKPISGKN